VRREILRLLKEDEEFRYTVAGLLGLQEVLQKIRKVLEELRHLREEQTKIWDEIKAIRRDMRALQEEQVRLREEQTKIWDEIKAIRRDFNEMLAIIKQMNERLTRLERTVEKMTIDVEEEARSFVEYRLKEKGIEISIDALRLPEAEINIYGANKDICVIGEASIRAGKKLIEELLKKYKLLKTKYPEYLREKTLLVLYVLLPTPELIEEAKKQNIWMFKSTKEYVPLEQALKTTTERKH